jgi:hypothetical protein
VTFDPKVGFILDPVTVLDAGTFRCKGANVRGVYNSSYLYYGRSLSWGDPEFMKFTLDVSKYFTEQTCMSLCCPFLSLLLTLPWNAKNFYVIELSRLLPG